MEDGTLDNNRKLREKTGQNQVCTTMIQTQRANLILSEQLALPSHCDSH